MKKTTFQKELNGIKVRTTLYGPVDSARWEREQRAQQHRLEQLQPYKRPEQKFLVTAKGDAYPIVGGKVQWRAFDTREED